MKRFLIISISLLFAILTSSCEQQTGQATPDGRPANSPAAVASATPAPTAATVPTAAPSGSPAAEAGNKQRESEMKTTPSGLQYQDLVVGNGAPVKVGDDVQVYYTGTLQNGTKFDSNVGKSPFSFRVGRDSVIKGWHLGIGGGRGIDPMRIGGRRKMILPADLGYSGMGQGVIPPNATLVFEVEVVGIKKARMF